MRNSLKGVFSQLTWTLVSFQLALVLGTIPFHFLLLDSEQRPIFKVNLEALTTLAVYGWPIIIAAILLTTTWVRNIPVMESIYNRLNSPPFGPWIREAPWWHFLIVSILAGVSEEWIFRGVLQLKLGFYFAAILFGLCHFLTFTYFVLATLMGLYLGLMFDASSNNLFPVISLHCIYDFIVLMLLKFHWNSANLDKN